MNFAWYWLVPWGSWAVLPNHLRVQGQFFVFDLRAFCSGSLSFFQHSQHHAEAVLVMNVVTVRRNDFPDLGRLSHRLTIRWRRTLLLVRLGAVLLANHCPVHGWVNGSPTSFSLAAG